MIRAKIVKKVDWNSVLTGLKRSLQNKILRPAITKTARIAAKDMKTIAPVRTGALRISLSQKVKTARTGGIFAIIGPRSDYTRTARGRVYRPVRYAHILETGSKFMAGLHWIANTWERNKEKYLDNVRRETAVEIMKQLPK
jgi:HK97 gp10 family phage protein